MSSILWVQTLNLKSLAFKTRNLGQLPRATAWWSSTGGTINVRFKIVAIRIEFLNSESWLLNPLCGAYQRNFSGEPMVLVMVHCKGRSDWEFEEIWRIEGENRDLEEMKKTTQNRIVKNVRKGVLQFGGLFLHLLVLLEWRVESISGWSVRKIGVI